MSLISLGVQAFSRYMPVALGEQQVSKSQPLTLKVRPLPTGGRPEHFSGAVGRYSMKVALDREEAAVNDAVALTATWKTGSLMPKGCQLK